jgi:protein KRI1
LQNLDLDGDWDPEAHDKHMAKIYGDDGQDVDVEKPHWDEGIDIGDIVETPDPSQLKKKKKKKEKGEGHEEDGVDVSKMDADVEPAEDDEDWDGTEEMRKSKLDEYMDEVYALGFNDIVRFQYAFAGQKLPDTFIASVGRKHAHTLQVHHR